MGTLKGAGKRIMGELNSWEFGVTARLSSRFQVWLFQVHVGRVYDDGFN